MNCPRGPLLSEAARLASDAHRSLVNSVLHLEAAGAIIPPETEEEIFELLDDADAWANRLLQVADAYGHAEVKRRRAA